MNAKIKRAWIRALRSGKYKQGRGFLRQGRRPFKYCCLGVLCDLYAKATKTSWDADDRLRGAGVALPRQVENWAGLEDGDPLLGDHTAIDWNDGTPGSRAVSFRRIATLIEEHL